MDDDRLGEALGDFRPTLYALVSVVYAERDGKILLLKRSGGALSGEWFLPGGAVDPGELPEDAAGGTVRGERPADRRATSR